MITKPQQTPKQLCTAFLVYGSEFEERLSKAELNKFVNTNYWAK